MISLDVTIGPEAYDDSHVSVVRNALTRNIRERFADIQGEIVTAFADYIPVHAKDGKLK